jgi:hypothetical protein
VAATGLECIAWLGSVILTLHDMKKIISKIHLRVGNRDGDAFAIKADDGKCYIVLYAESFHNAEEFEGMGSTEHVEIPEAAFVALVADA